MMKRCPNASMATGHIVSTAGGTPDALIEAAVGAIAAAIAAGTTAVITAAATAAIVASRATEAVKKLSVSPAPWPLAAMPCHYLRSNHGDRRLPTQ